MCAIALLSGMTLILSQGRAGSSMLNSLFVVATFVVLFVILQAITYLAQRTMKMSTTLSSQHDDKNKHNSNTSSNH